MSVVFLLIDQFVSQGHRRVMTPVLLISYETFRLHANVLHTGTVGLIICDEVQYIYLCVYVCTLYLHVCEYV